MWRSEPVRAATATAQAAVRQARQDLRRQWPDLVGSVIWYGAVDLDPQHLVVWVLLRGEPEQLPEWFFPRDGAACHVAAAEGLGDELSQMLTTVRQACDRLRWPDAAAVSVGFDSEERVADSGGWHYFR